MTFTEITIGLKVFNRGDQANLEHYGTVTRKIDGGRFSNLVEITPDSDRAPYTITPSDICTVDKNNGLTRIVTKEAHEEMVKALIERMTNRYSK